MSFPNHVRDFLQAKAIDAESGIVVAFSTGVDSMVLLHLLQELKVPLVVAHVNHGKRKASKAEEQFCKDYCEKANLPCEILHLDEMDKPANANFQNWARNQRYAFFTAVAKTHNCAYIATAHHATDKAETFFMNALRGSGLSGLTSLKPVNGKIIRPLIAFSKTEIVAYAKHQNLTWFEDASNNTDAYLRNRFRHRVLPASKKVDPHWAQGLANTLKTLNEEQALIQSLVKDWELRHVRHEGDAIHISLSALNEQPSPKALLWYLLKDIDPTLPLTNMALAFNDQTGSQYFGQTHVGLRERDWLIIRPKSTVQSDADETHIYAEELKLDTPLALAFEQQAKPSQFNSKDLHLDRHSALLDFDRLSFPLTLRKWQEGDKFRPLGMKGSKKLSDFLIDEKVSRFDKENVYVLCSNNEIVWVVGHRIGDRFKVGKDTQIMYIGRLHKSSV